MDEILKSLAQHTGIDVATARTALGAVMTFLKEHLPEGVSGQLMSAVPESQGLVTSFDQNKTGGGLLGMVTGMATKVFGGDTSKLLDMLGKSGLSLTQVHAFLPKALELLKQHLPAEVAEKISGLVSGALAAAPKA